MTPSKDKKWISIQTIGSDQSYYFVQLIWHFYKIRGIRHIQEKAINSICVILQYSVCLG